MRRFVAAAIGWVLLAGSGLATGQQRGQRPRLQTRLPQGTKVLRNVEYARIGEKRALKLDLYLPAGGGKGLRRPLVIWVHGGGWRGGSKSSTPAVALLRDGFAVASVEYRLTGEAVFPAQINDCKGAVRFLRANADKYGLDPNAFGAWGSSAGGHLVALMGTAGDANELEGDVGGNAGVSSRVQAVCDWFGPTDFTVMRTAGSRSPVTMLLGGPPDEKADLARQASPVRHVSKDDPPFLIVHGDKDRLVPLSQSVRLDEALRKAGVESELHVVKGAGHGRFRDPAVAEKVRRFFRSHLQRERDDPGEQAVPDSSTR